MGLTKEYARYVPAGTFNIIASENCNVKFVTLEGQEGRFVAVGACEHIIIWDLRLGEKAQVLPGEKAMVTSVCVSPNKRHLAAGYSDGNVQIYDLKSAEITSIFSGHKGEVTTLAYDNYGHKLASGSKDTDVIVWDTVAETGLCRLSGHKGPVSQVVFMSGMPILISGSKDTFVKFWDLDSQYCFKTLVGHRTEISSICLVKDDQFLITGCGDAELRMWKLSQKDLDIDNRDPVKHLTNMLEMTTVEDADDPKHPLQVFKAGSILRAGKGRVISMYSDPNGHIVGCHGADTQLELFYFCSDEEIQTRLKKRLKKQRNKKKVELSLDTAIEEDSTNDNVILRDFVQRLNSIKLSTKPKSLDLVLGNGGELRITVNLSNNSIELYTMQTDVKNSEASRLRAITIQGHRSETRSICFSNDNLAVVSGSAEAIKMWNRPSQVCLRTINSGYVLSTIFVPGDRHVLAGLKNGKLLIIDIAAGDILEEIPAHSAELWSICLEPDQAGCVTGGGDKTVKFWKLELVTVENSGAKVLSLLHKRTLVVDDVVLCVKISSNRKFVAVALLDSTVKIFFVDTFKFFLSLYGHKLPVLCLDISSDSTLIATGSADRNVKIWGMDFGDCHKSIFAHEDSVTGLQFVPKTHYFFTCGKDGKIKQWDADNYEKIITLQGHVGEAWALSVSSNGQYVISCGADRVFRLYEKTDQPLILEDEHEEEREQQELATGDQTVIPGKRDVILPSKKTVGSENAAESILECLDICEKYKELLAEHEALQAASTQTLPSPQAPLLMQALNAVTTDDFFLKTIKRIRASDLEEALLLLPFGTVHEVIQLVLNLANRGDETELVCKMSIFLLKLHHKPIVSNSSMLVTLKQLEKVAFAKVQELRDVIGYNLYGMQAIQRDIEAAEGVQLFRDATMQKRKGDKKRKQREKLKRSIMVLNN